MAPWLATVMLAAQLGCEEGEPAEAPAPTETAPTESEKAPATAEQVEPVPETDPVWTGAVSEEAFRAMHEHRAEEAPEPKGQTVEVAGTDSYLSLPEGAESPMPGIIVIHEWWGLNDHVRHWADRLAAEGYAALAVDLYGGDTATDPDAAMELMRAVDETRSQEILEAAYRFLKNDERIEAGKAAVIGWCFGGGWALKAGLALEDLDAVVMYYGQPVKDVSRLRALDAPLLGVFANRDDSIPPSEVDAFDQALDEADVDHQILRYNAQHAFANPSGARYDADAAESAWREVGAFLHQHLD